MAATPSITSATTGLAKVVSVKRDAYRIDGSAQMDQFIHTDAVYNALINAANVMEERLKESLENYQKHPDVQANLQQLQYDLQAWNLALTTMTNINKNMGDALNSIASNFR